MSDRPAGEVVAAPKMGMRVVQVTSDLGPASGSSYTALPQLCRRLEAAGCEVHLLSTDERDRQTRCELRNDFDVAFFPKARWARSLGRSPALDREVRRLGGQADLFHVHGMWRLSTIYALHEARRRQVPAIVSPLGTFAPAALQIARLRKRAFWTAFQRPALRDVACYHAASQTEHDQLRDFGVGAPVAVIPLGVDMPSAFVPKPTPDDRRVLLFLGRISPIKNLLSLVAAWRAIQEGFPSASLRIVGPDDRGHRETVRHAVEELGAERVSVEHEVFGPARDELYASSDIVILPSLSESFGLIVPEALAVGRPVIATSGSPWQVLAERDCGWWVDPTVETLAGTIREALTLPSERLADMGRRGRELAMQQFSWPRSVSRFVALYEWVLGGGAPPEFVST